MARLSDIIEAFIKDLINESNEEEVEIQRNELASHFSCAPSQINYVLTTRFTQDKGYYIESRRGGGGCIRISKVRFVDYGDLADAINLKIGDYLTNDNCNRIIDNLIEEEFLTEREGKIIKIALNDRTLSGVAENRNRIRADILKTIIFNIFS